MTTVELYRQNGVEYRSINLCLMGDGIRIAGHDMGPAVEQMWNDDDYEFWAEVHSRDLPTLAFALIRDRWSGQSESVTDFTMFCKANGVPIQEGNWA